MFVVGTAQPYYPQASGPSDGTYFLTLEERRRFADDLTERRLDEIPVVLEHAGAERAFGDAADIGRPGGRPFRVPNEKRIGRASEAVVDRHGHLIIASELFYNTPELKEVVEGINTRGEVWGYSLCTDAERPDLGVVRNKRVTHLGLTRDPAYGTGNDKGGGATWLHAARTTAQGIEEVLGEYANEPGMYVPEPIRRRLAAGRRPPAAATVVSVGATAAPPPRGQRDSESESPHIIPPLSSPGSTALPAARPPPAMSAPLPAIAPADGVIMGAPAPHMPRIDSAAILAANPPPAAAAPGTGAPMSPAALVAAHLQNQAATNNGQQRSPEQIELMRRDLEDLNRRTREVLSKVDFSKLAELKDIDEATYYQATDLRRRLMSEIERAQLPITQLPMGVNASLGKLEEYIMSVNEKLQDHVSTTSKDKESIAAYERYFKEPDTYRPLVTQVMATRNALYSQKEAERKLQEERAVLEKQYKEVTDEKERMAKRVRELEEGNNAMNKRYRYDPPPPVSSLAAAPVTAPTPTVSVGASNGSSDLPKGAVLDDFWTSRMPASRDHARQAGWIAPQDEKVLAVIQHVRRAAAYATSAGMTTEGLPESLRH